MLILIFLALLVIIALLAPWLISAFAALFAVVATLFLFGAALTGGVIACKSYARDIDRQQARMEKRVKKITDAANKANSQKGC